MKTIKYKKGTYVAVYVEWFDSVSQSQPWWNIQQLEEETKIIRDTFQTLAYLVNENNHEYIFANSIHLSENKPVAVANIFNIPKGCIVSIKKVKQI